MSKYSYIPKIITANMMSDKNMGAAFWITNITMFIQNYIFLIVWFCIFQISPKLGEWEFRDYLNLEAVVMMAFGVSLVFTGGARSLAEMVDTCQIDALLTRPKNVLISTLIARTKLFAMGDFCAGFVMMIYLTYNHLDMIMPILALTLLAAVALTSFFIIIQSMIFWKSDSTGFINQMIEFFIILSCNPQNGFGIKAKFILHTILPAAYIGYLPVEILRDPTLQNISLMICGVFGLAAIACTIFYAGLRRYKSGNVMYQISG